MPSDAQTILVVDDEPAIRNILVEVLCEEGYTVVEANDGKDAVHLLEQHQPPPEVLCLVLLDMMLPHVDGIAVLQHLASLNSYVPVVAMSASRLLKK